MDTCRALGILGPGRFGSHVEDYLSKNFRHVKRPKVYYRPCLGEAWVKVKVLGKTLGGMALIVMTKHGIPIPETFMVVPDLLVEDVVNE